MKIGSEDIEMHACGTPRYHNANPAAISMELSCAAAGSSTQQTMDMSLESSEAHEGGSTSFSDLNEGPAFLSIPEGNDQELFTDNPCDTNCESTKLSGHVLSWSKVNIKLKTSKNGTRHLLKNVDGVLLPGQLTAIMGHSGAGKSTLLNILAGKIKSSSNLSVKYDIKLDGERVTPSATNVRKKIAFVAQQDVLFKTATPREAIGFSARLRLPRHVSDESVELLTHQILDELKLLDVADSKIANLSGGEMRRTSLGIELVVRPAIVLLDEVTSGLDSYNAMQVLEVLKKVSARGASVLFTLHQPNSQMFATIDHLILMNHGRCMYQGAVNCIPAYFAERGHPVPSNYNPADWILMVSEGVSSNEELENRGFFGNFPDEQERKSSCNSMVAMAQSKNTSGRKLKKKNSMFQASRVKNGVSMSQEIGLLLKRGWYNILRDRKLLMLRFVMIGIGATIIALVFGQVGSSDITSIMDFQSHLGALFFLCMAGTIITQVVLLEFIDERAVVLREFSTNHYGLISHTISRLIIEGISVFLQILLFLVIIYWALGLQGRFWYLLLCFYTFGMAGASTAVMLGSYTNDPRDAKEFIPMVMLPQILFCGFFVSISSVPFWLRWIQWLMPLTYTFRLVIGEEFSFCEHQTDLFGPVCHSYLKSQEATKDVAVQYWLSLIGIIAFQRIVAVFLLKRKMQMNDSSA